MAGACRHRRLRTRLIQNGNRFCVRRDVDVASVGIQKDGEAKKKKKSVGKCTKKSIRRPCGLGRTSQPHVSPAP